MNIWENFPFWLMPIRVVLLRHYSKEYEEALSKYEVEFIPVLRFDYLNLDKLQLILQTPVHLIITSANAIEAVKKVLDKVNIQGRVAFVVGEQTAKAANEIGLDPKGKSTGNAANLVKYILENRETLMEHRKDLIWLHGNLADDSLIATLKNEGIHIKDIVVYETTQIPIDEIRDSIVVVFSPSGFNAVGKFTNCDFVSLGPTTFNELQKSGVESVKASEPTPYGISQAVQSIILKKYLKQLKPGEFGTMQDTRMTALKHKH